MRLRLAFIHINTQEFSANNISTNLFSVSIHSRLSALLCLLPAFISSQESLVVLWQYFVSSFSPFRKPFVFVMIVRHIFEISDDSRMRITTKSVHDKNDYFALRYVRIYPGVNSRAELVTLAPGLRPGSGTSYFKASVFGNQFYVRLQIVILFNNGYLCLNIVAAVWSNH